MFRARAWPLSGGARATSEWVSKSAQIQVGKLGQSQGDTFQSVEFNDSARRSFLQLLNLAAAIVFPDAQILAEASRPSTPKHTNIPMHYRRRRQEFDTDSPPGRLKDLCKRIINGRSREPQVCAVGTELRGGANAIRSLDSSRITSPERDPVFPLAPTRTEQISLHQQECPLPLPAPPPSTSGH